MNLAKNKQLLKGRLLPFTEVLVEQSVQVWDLIQELPEVSHVRNSAVSGGEPSLRTDASHIRRWRLGKGNDLPNTFAVVMLDTLTCSATEVGS